MKNKMMNNVKRKANKGMKKNNMLMEIAEDLKDLVANAKNFNKKNKMK